MLAEDKLIYLLGQMQGKIQSLMNKSCELEDDLNTLKNRFNDIMLNDQKQTLVDNEFNSDIENLRISIEKLDCRLNHIENRINTVYTIAEYTLSIIGVGAAVIGTLQIFKIL